MSIIVYCEITARRHQNRRRINLFNALAAATAAAAAGTVFFSTKAVVPALPPLWKNIQYHTVFIHVAPEMTVYRSKYDTLSKYNRIMYCSSLPLTQRVAQSDRPISYQQPIIARHSVRIDTQRKIRA